MFPDLKLPKPETQNSLESKSVNNIIFNGIRQQIILK